MSEHVDHPDSLSDPKARSQRALIEFLKVDLDLAFTFLTSANWELEPTRPTPVERLKRRGRLCGRSFQDRIEDPVERQEIHKGADDLEAVIKGCSK